ncbi:hypothetical protein COU54_02065 [Candidatus Pacearchaeota archaeon CG10_big_fil_rev_8_21_14_0_10_31_24]|nr:MAG: hypothetical protein COU54_02065 [Candidatus Pacearchaeota archaeon CG10_big_fil_rev_8_21_14_0_10_31_24]
MPIALLVFVIVWNLIWKGFAWWKSARNNHPVWFIAFILIQTMGILEILYIFLFSKIDLNKKPTSIKLKKKRK